MLRDSNDTHELLPRPARTIQDAFALSVAELLDETTWVEAVAPEWEM